MKLSQRLHETAFLFEKNMSPNKQLIIANTIKNHSLCYKFFEISMVLFLKFSPYF
jgi:hypothetical protein